MTRLILLTSLFMIRMLLTGCTAQSRSQTLPTVSPAALTRASSASNQSFPQAELPVSLEQSWKTYRQRFIQSDGRVIDRESEDRSLSEAQAYAMLRAVWINDPETFARTLEWAEHNLQRQQQGQRIDHLWAWKWGRNPQGEWRILDVNFASDADLDAITALILAARTWERPDYLQLAKRKLQDLWNLSTLKLSERRYLLPGPVAAFRQQDQIILNPSYLAPYAFRLFAQVDPERDWLSLVESSYFVLNTASRISAVGLPSDWIVLNAQTQQFQPLKDHPSLSSNYGFDAYRVWWRIALDAEWFQSPEAIAYLKAQLPFLVQQWQAQQRLVARFDLQGTPRVDYEATAQYGMLYPALRLIEPVIAKQIRQQKLIPQYQQGFWDHDRAYYTQNLVWLGLSTANLPLTPVLQPPNSKL